MNSPTTKRGVPDGRTTSVVRRITGKVYWGDLTADDRLKVSERCIRDARRENENGNRRRALDELQDARSLIAEARREIQNG